LWLDPTGSGARPLTVVGVVTEVRRDWRHEEPGGVYLPFAQAPRPAMFVSLRTTGNPSRHISAVRARIQQLDSVQPLPQPKPMKQVVVESMAGLFITAGVLTFMGLVSLLVAAGGIYSVVANSVSQRTREIGIRMALGARPLDVLRQVLGEGLRMAVVGVLAGLPAAVAVSTVFRHSVHGIPRLEAVWFALLALVLLGVTLVACYLPARRAAAIDPLVALRAE
jgi:putative ABC transport system permease protein